MKNILRTNFDGDGNIGLYGFATDKYCFMGNARYAAKLKPVLKVKTVSFPIFNMDLIRLFCTGNSRGVVMSKIVSDFDEDAASQLRNKFDVLTLDTRATSVGNLMLINDKGIIISPMLRKHKAELTRFFGIKCEICTIAGMNIVGNLGFATNKGCLAHPKLKEVEKKVIEKTLGVDCDIETVNFGSPYPGAGLIGNSNGFAISESSSGPEMGQATDILGFL